MQNEGSRARGAERGEQKSHRHDDSGSAVANDRSLARQHAFDGIGSSLCLALLNEADAYVDNDDSANETNLGKFLKDTQDDGGDDEDENENVVELRPQLHVEGRLLGRRQLVEAIGLKPLVCLCRCEPLRDARFLKLLDLFDGLGLPVILLVLHLGRGTVLHWALKVRGQRLEHSASFPPCRPFVPLAQFAIKVRHSVIEGAKW